MAALVVIFASIIALCHTAPSAPLDQTTCTKELENAGASSIFDAVVAHGIHSMTVDTLQMFDPTATEDNYVPTIDVNLRSDQAILPYAPPARKTNDTDSFLTEGMKVLDSVLSHMNEEHWDIAAFSSLERVAHAFHMREVWARIKVEYDKLGKSLPAPSATACQCALDIDNNGIMKTMRFIAMALREPSLVYGNPKYSKRGRSKPEDSYEENRYKLYGLTVSSKNLPMQSLLSKNVGDIIPPLKDKESWKQWKKNPDSPLEHNRDPAIFLYCALAKGRAEQKQQ